MFLDEELQGFQETTYRAFLATIMSFVAFSIHVCIGCASMYFIFVTKRQSPYANFHALFIGTLLLLGTINIALWGSMMAEAARLVFLPPDASEFDVLPSGYVAYGAGAGAASILITVMCDALLLYRCWVIWEKRLYIVILPLLAYLAAICLGMADLGLFWTFRRRNGLTPYPTIYPITAAYWFTLLSLNILLTILIVARIVYLLRSQHLHIQTHTTQSPSRGRNMATAAMSIFVESSLLYSLAVIIGLAFNWWFFKSKTIPRQTIPLMIAFEVSPFNPYLTHLECLASELIILRVALGRAWKSSVDASSEGSTTELGTVHFRSPTTALTTGTVEMPIRWTRGRPRSSFEFYPLEMETHPSDARSRDENKKDRVGI